MSLSSTCYLVLVISIMCLFPVAGVTAEIGVSLFHDFNDIDQRPLMIEKVVGMGVEWIKIELRMDYCQPSPGVYDWPTEEIEALASHGLKIFASLSYTPGWSNGYRQKEYPCSNPADWYGFVAAVVQQFNDQIDYWGLWNEPGTSTFFRCDGNDCVSEYITKVFLPGAQAIRDQLGENYVVAPQTNYENSGNVNPSGKNGVEFLKRTLQQLETGNNLHLLDVISHHIFNVYESGYWVSFRKYFEDSDLLTLKDHYGKQLWIGDFGWKIPPSKQSDYARHFTDGIYDLLKRCSVDRCFIYMFNDNQYTGDYYGAVYDGMPYVEKKHYYTVRDYQLPQVEDLVFEAEHNNFFHQTGRPNQEGWEASTGADSAGFLLYGPYAENVKAGYRKAIFGMRIDNNSVNNDVVARIEVTNLDYSLPIPAPGKILVSRDIHRQDFPSANAYHDFMLEFYHHGGDDRLEFRVYWHDKSFISVDKITVPGIFSGNDGYSYFLTR